MKKFLATVGNLVTEIKLFLGVVLGAYMIVVSLNRLIFKGIPQTILGFLLIPIGLFMVTKAIEVRISLKQAKVLPRNKADEINMVTRSNHL